MAGKRTIINGVPVKYHNFAGVKTDYNREGDVNFEIIIDEETALNMMEDGWYIKINEDDLGRKEYRIKIRLGEFGDPQVFIIGDDGKAIPFNRGQWKRIDRMTISYVDVEFHQSRKTFMHDGHEYYSAYADNLFVNIVENSLYKKYGIAPDYADDEMGLDD
ncbi:MAG: hypothetical protein J6U54_08760 [Clostridiales bacterium]|nr:hypothetical protein [Clostridiales bacterium]